MPASRTYTDRSLVGGRLGAALWPAGAPVWDRALVAGVGIIALCAAWTVVSAMLGSHPQPNLHSLQADAFLHGNLDVSRSVEDVALFRGRIYSPYPPAPALLLVPFVAVFGTGGSIPIAIAVLLTLVNGWLALRICRAAGLGERQAVLMTAALLLGTAYWTATTGSDSVWYFSHIVAMTGLLGAIERAMNHHPLAAGTLIGVAFLSRQFTVVALVFVLALLIDAEPGRAGRTRAVLYATIPVMACAVGYAWFNSSRFTGPIDTGYSYIVLSGFLAQRVEQHGLFDPAYIPFNFIYLFLQGFQVEFAGGQLLRTAGTSPFGTSITVASPFLFFAVLARRSRLVIAAGWCAIGVCVVGSLAYYNNGFAQQNAQRFSLDFIPVLFVLMAWGVARTRTRIWEATAIYAIGLNFIALFVLAHTGPLEQLFGAR